MPTVVKKHTRLAGEERNKVRKEVAGRYRGGESIRELAESTGRSYGGIYLLLQEAGVKMRARGGPRRGPRKRTT